MHELLEERLRQRDKDYEELVNSIESLQSSFLDAMDKLNEKIQNIHSKLAGDLDTGEVGWVTRVNLLEAKYATFEKEDIELRSTVAKMVPWFATMRWMVVIITPTMILGFISLIAGLLTGKIQIIM